MPIIFPKATEEGRQIAYEHIAWTLRVTPGFLKGARIEELTIADLYQNYCCKPKDITLGRLLSAAKPTTWRYLVMRGTNAVGTVELKADKKTGKALKVVAFHRSRNIEMLEALHVAEKLPQVKKGDYEFRYLNIFPIYFFAVWIHERSDDIIIPMPPGYGIWNAYQPYSEKEIIKILQPEAIKPHGALRTNS